MIYLKFNRNNLWRSSFNDITDGGPLLLQNWNLLRVFKISTTEADFELKAKLITILLISWFHDLMFHWFFQLNRHNLGCTNSFKGTITLCKSKHLWMEFRNHFNFNIKVSVKFFLLHLYLSLFSMCKPVIYSVVFLLKWIWETLSEFQKQPGSFTLTIENEQTVSNA